MYRAELGRYRQQLKQWEQARAQAKSEWETRCARAFPDKWQQKAALEASIDDLDARCRSLSGMDAPTNFEAGPFQELDRAKERLYELIAGLEPPADPPQPKVPEPLGAQPVRLWAYGLSWLVAIVVIWKLLSMQGEPAPAPHGHTLLAGVLSLLSPILGFLAVASAFLLVALVSQTVSLAAGYAAAKIANALGYVLSRPKLHWILRLAAWADLGWNVWTRVNPH